jgi:hypothetical protein
MNFQISACHIFHHEKTLKVYSAVGNCDVVCKSQSVRRYRNYCTVLNTKQKFPIPFPCPCPCLCHARVRIMSVSVYRQIPFPLPCPFLCLCPFLFPCLFLCPFQFKYGAMNIYIWHGTFNVNSQGLYEVAWKRKGPLTWEKMGKTYWKSWRLSSPKRHSSAKHISLDRILLLKDSSSFSALKSAEFIDQIHFLSIKLTV